MLAFIAGAYLELDFVAFAQIFEIDLGSQPRAMEKDLVTAVIGDDKAEALVLYYFLDGAVHFDFVRGRARAPIY